MTITIVDEQVVLEVTSKIKVVLSPEDAKSLGEELQRAGTTIKADQRLKKWREQGKL